MKTLYLDLGMGAAGDMLTAALLELCENKERAAAALNALGLPGVRFLPEACARSGIVGTHMRVAVNGAEEELPPQDHAHAHPHDHTHEHTHPHDHDHPHVGLAEIRSAVSALRASDKVKADVLAVYRLIADAESRVHGRPVEAVHFHEVGAMDAVADVTAVCWLMEALAPERVAASPVHVGSGTVRCAHGILPVPAPATALLLEGIPTYGGEIKSELCTPTGAALIRYFVKEFTPQPLMAVQKIGFGMGKKEFDRANCVRALLGDAGAAPREEIYELSCNVDDMTAERVAFACERIFEAGAKEVFTLPAGMKKGRPGTLIKVLCAAEEKEAVVRAIFRHTATIGIRECAQKRYVLDRRTETVQTPLGPVRKKCCEGYGITREKYEYEDLARIAKERSLSIEEVLSAIEASE